MDRRRIEALILLLIALTVLWDGTRIMMLLDHKTMQTMGAPQAGGYLVLLGLVLGCLALRHGLEPRSRGTEASKGWGANLHYVAIAAIVFAGYMSLWEYLGYLLSTAVFFVIFLRVFSAYHWRSILIGSAAFAIGSAYLWVLVGLVLPQGIVPWP